MWCVTSHRVCHIGEYSFKNRALVDHLNAERFDFFVEKSAYFLEAQPKVTDLHA